MTMKFFNFHQSYCPTNFNFKKSKLTCGLLVKYYSLKYKTKTDCYAIKLLGANCQKTHF